jgi:catechol 2,3-dioxygenase-like lactoylglutathione lyase family enzyme
MRRRFIQVISTGFLSAIAVSKQSVAVPQAPLVTRTPPVSSPLSHVSVISLFVEDLRSAKSFYRGIFDAPIIVEDATSAAFQFDNVIVNLVRADTAREVIKPGVVASRDSGSRFQLTVWVPDVDAVCKELRKRGVKILTGPVNRSWGVRTANFVDPAGHSWEVAQQLASR